MTVKRKDIDELLRLVRKNRTTGDGDIWELVIKKAQDISDTRWLALCDFASAVLSRGGFCVGMSNDRFCALLGLCGVCVVGKDNEDGDA